MEFDYRTPENRAGVVFDETKLSRLFAEDLQNIYDAFTLLYSFGDYFAVAHIHSDQSITFGASATAIKFDTVEIDPLEILNTTDKQFVIPIKSRFRFTTHLSFNFGAPAQGQFVLSLFKNNSMVKQSKYMAIAGFNSFNLDEIVDCDIGDVFDIRLGSVGVPAGTVYSNSKESNFSCQLVQMK